MRPNILASIALWLWIPITLCLFRRYRPAFAASISIIGAGALLPNGLAFDFPLIPPLDRNVMAVIACMLGCMTFAPRYLRERSLGRDPTELFAILLVFGALGTALTNGDAVMQGAKHLLPLRVQDTISIAAGSVLTLWLPFYLGRALIRSPRDLAAPLIVLAVGGLLYSVLTLWEIRVSPHLNRDLYGYHPGQWAMSRRGGLWGWRPMVFVGHGISLTMFMLACTVAAATLVKARADLFRGNRRLAVPYLYAVLFACQSMASFLYATVALPLLIFLRPRIQALILIVLCVVLFTYPVLRAFDVFPTAELVSFFADRDPERAASLRFRFDNEDRLVDRASERILFGWGGYGRNRLYDDITGDKDVVTDGYWIIVLGLHGAIGYLGTFGMLIVPVLVAARALRRSSTRSVEAVLLAGTAWICILSTVDLLPNAFYGVRHAFLTGALVGAVRGWKAGGMLKESSDRVVDRARIQERLPESAAASLRLEPSPGPGTPLRS